MANRIEIFTKVNDTRSEIMKSKISALGFTIHSATVIETYTINKEFPEDTLTKIAKILSNPVSQEYSIGSPITSSQNIDFDFALEIGFP